MAHEKLAVVSNIKRKVIISGQRNFNFKKNLVTVGSGLFAVLKLMLSQNEISTADMMAG